MLIKFINLCRRYSMEFLTIMTTFVVAGSVYFFPDSLYLIVENIPSINFIPIIIQYIIDYLREREYILIDPTKIYFEFDPKYYFSADRYWIKHPGFMGKSNEPVTIGSIYLEDDRYIFEDNTCVKRTPECEGFGTDLLTYVNSENFLPFVYRFFLKPVPHSLDYKQIGLIREKAFENWIEEEEDYIVEMPPEINDFVMNFFTTISQESLYHQKKLYFSRRKHMKFAFMDQILRVGISDHNPLYTEIKPIEYSNKMEMGNEYIHANTVLIEHGLIRKTNQISNYTVSEIGLNANKYGFNEAENFNFNELNNTISWYKNWIILIFSGISAIWVLWSVK